MAETQTAEPDNQTAAEKKSGGSLISKLLIVAFMGGVVAIECAIAYVLIPDAEEVAALAEKKMADRLPKSLSSKEGLEENPEMTVEINLGDYSITVSQPNASTSLRVDFQLFGTVLEEDKQEAQALFDRHVHRFRDQVLYEIRNSEPADLADPGLGLIKRRILEKSNNLFGKALLRSILFSEFSYVEQ